MAAVGKRLWMVVACGWLSAMAGAGAGELLSNGRFDEIMVNWTVPDKLEPWIPYSHPDGRVKLHPDVGGYKGAVLSQSLNVTGIAGQTVTASIDLGSDWQMPPGNTVVVYVKYLDSTGAGHREALIQPANASIPVGSMATFTGSYTFPGNAAKLVLLEIAKEDFGEAMADNVSLTSPTLVAGLVPHLEQVEPSAVAYGQSFIISGTNLGGAVAPEVLLNGTANGLQVTGWTNSSVTVNVSTPAAGGSLEVIVAGTPACERRQLGITSPHCALKLAQSSFTTITGMPVILPLWVDMRNGYAPAGGLALQVMKGAVSVPIVVAPQVTRTGGTFVRIPSSALTAGTNRLAIRGSGGGYTTPDLFFDIVLEVAASGTFMVQNAAVTSYSATQQGSVSLNLKRFDAAGSPLLTEAPVTWTSTKSNVCVAFVDSGFGGTQLLVHGPGSAIIKGTTPDGLVYSLPVTVTLPVSPRILTFTVSPSTIDNSGLQSGVVITELNVPITSSSISYPNGFELGFPTWDLENKWMSRPITPIAGLAPGVYKLDTTASSMQRSTRVTIVNAAGKGMISGRVATFGSGEMGNYMHLIGKVEFYDAGGNKVTPGAGEDDLMISAFGTDVYQAAYLDPGVYRVRWVDEITGKSKWWPNADTFADAAPVTVNADTLTTGVHFFFGETAKTPPEVTGAPLFNAEAQTCGIPIQTEQSTRYELQRSETMLENTWYSVAELWGNGSVQIITDGAANADMEFYRVLKK